MNGNVESQRLLTPLEHLRTMVNESAEPEHANAPDLGKVKTEPGLQITDVQSVSIESGAVLVPAVTGDSMESKRSCPNNEISAGVRIKQEPGVRVSSLQEQADRSVLNSSKPVKRTKKVYTVTATKYSHKNATVEGRGVVWSAKGHGEPECEIVVNGGNESNSDEPCLKISSVRTFTAHDVDRRDDGTTVRTTGSQYGSDSDNESRLQIDEAYNFSASKHLTATASQMKERENVQNTASTNGLYEATPLDNIQVKTEPGLQITDIQGGVRVQSHDKKKKRQQSVAGSAPNTSSNTPSQKSAPQSSNELSANVKLEPTEPVVPLNDIPIVTQKLPEVDNMRFCYYRDKKTNMLVPAVIVRPPPQRPPTQHTLQGKCCDMCADLYGTFLFSNTGVMMGFVQTGETCILL